MGRIFKRALVVDGGYQIRQAVVVIISNMLIALGVAALLTWFYLMEWDGSIAYNHNHVAPVLLAGVVAFVAIAVPLFSFRRSRELAGMMKKMKWLLEDAAAGKVPEQQVRFRRSDYFGYLAEPLNKCFEQIRQRQAGVDACYADELSAIRELLASGGDLNQVVTRLDRLIGQLKSDNNEL